METTGPTTNRSYGRDRKRDFCLEDLATRPVPRRDFLRVTFVGGLSVAAFLFRERLLPRLPGFAPSTDVLATAVDAFASSPEALPSPTASGSAISVRVDPGTRIATNNLSSGYMLDHDWETYLRDGTLRNYARNAHFGIVRIFDRRIGLCRYWNEATRTGTFDWTNVDELVRRILETGAEPMFCLGGYGSGGPLIPNGMAVNPDTNLPYPESFADYAAEWVRHFEKAGLPVRYYEIVNEPWMYFGWEPVDFTKLERYVQLFNATASIMRRENSNVLISHDFMIRKQVLDYWLSNGGADVDSLNFHKYDCYVAWQKSDAEMFAAAEQDYFETWPMGYSVDEARQVWARRRGKLLPVINSESNFNSAWEMGTDPRIQQMAGAVWAALVLRMAVLKGLRYNIYYTLSSSAAYGKTTQTGGAGFGMINATEHRPWYPYYVHLMLGSNLAPGDPLLHVKSSSDNVRALAWIHHGSVMIFLICKVDEPRTVNLQGVKGRMEFFKIDNKIPWTTPAMQMGETTAEKPLTVSGYTVTLLKLPLS